MSHNVEFSSTRRDARVNVNAYVTDAPDLVSTGFAHAGKTWRPESISVGYAWAGEQWNVINPKIAGSVLKKNGEPGQQSVTLMGYGRDYVDLFPQWAIDFIEAHRPTSGQP